MRTFHYVVLGCSGSVLICLIYTFYKTQAQTELATSNSLTPERTELVSPNSQRTLDSVSSMVTQENWMPPSSVPDHIQNLDQADPELAQHIRDHWLLPPSTLPRNLSNPNKTHYSQLAQSAQADQLFHQKTNGFFIECGAFTGEVFSNSLFFEKSRNWTGVLIEADSTFNAMRNKHRHAYLLNVCLSPTTRPVKIPFRLAGIIGGLPDFMPAKHVQRIEKEGSHVNNTVLLQCFPMYSILRAIGVTHVDYFSLDIEGAEPEVLATLPLDEMTVDVFTIEHNGFPDKIRQIKEILVDKYGYVVANKDGQDITLTRKGFTQS